MKLNKAQVYSLLRTVLKIAGAALATHGAGKVGAFLNSEEIVGLIMAAIGVWLSHSTHASDLVDTSDWGTFDPPSQGSGAASPTSKPAGLGDLPRPGQSLGGPPVDPQKPNQK